MISLQLTIRRNVSGITFKTARALTASQRAPLVSTTENRHRKISTVQKNLTGPTRYQNTNLTHRAFVSSNIPNICNMSTSQSTQAETNSQNRDSEINFVLDWWFSLPPWQHFMPPDRDAMDKEILSRYEPLILAARTESLDSWASTPRGALALVILLDQFPRNCYRGSSDSFDTDEKARGIAVRALAAGFDRKLPFMQRYFLFMPLMHHEDLTSQIACLALFEALLLHYPDDTHHPESAKAMSKEDRELRDFLSKGMEFSARHMDTIRRFGRYPGRNEALGRESTEEEKQFLKDHPEGF